MRSKTPISRSLALGGVVGRADQLDDLVDVEDRDQQALDQVEPVGGLGTAVGRAPAYDVEAVVEEHLEHVLEPERPRLAVDQRDGVDAEGVLHRGQPVELLEQRLGDEAVLHLDHQAQAVLAVGEVLDVGDALELLGLHQRLDPLRDLLGADAVRQLGDHDALATPDRLDARGGAHPERAAARSRRRRGPRRARRSCRRSAGPGPGTKRIRSSRVASGWVTRWRSAWTTSTRLCGAMLVAIPTAMPVAPLTTRWGIAAGSTTGSSSRLS